MNTFTDIWTTLVNWLDTLWGLPAKAIIFLMCLAVCEMIRRSKTHNSVIPYAASLTGAIFAMLLADPYDVQVPLRIWVGLNIGRGVLCGMLAHYFHWKVLVNTKSKVPVIGGILASTGGSDPTAFVKGRNAEVEEIKADPKD